MENNFPILISPRTKAPFSKLCVEQNELEFDNGETYPLYKSIPILIDEENSLFNINDILKIKDTTQSNDYSNTKKAKNFIRRKILPSLSNDKYLHERYLNLAERVEGERVLVLGAGEKIAFYKAIFSKSDIVTSDVHIQYQPDVVFDAHSIPFADKSFGLILAGQVLEHTIQPWVVAKEIQRVSIDNAIIQIEVPFNFPYHAHPYDFFRFTFTGLRSLFNESALENYHITEGNASTVAIFNSEFVVNLFKKKILRSGALLFGRLAWGWLKYLDKSKDKDNINIRDLSMPKGIAMTFVCDKKERNQSDLLKEYYNIIKL